jgi:hypothetical protein
MSPITSERNPPQVPSFLPRESIHRQGPGAGIAMALAPASRAKCSPAPMKFRLAVGHDCGRPT